MSNADRPRSMSVGHEIRSLLADAVGLNLTHTNAPIRTVSPRNSNLTTNLALPREMLDTSDGEFVRIREAFDMVAHRAREQMVDETTTRIEKWMTENLEISIKLNKTDTRLEITSSITTRNTGKEICTDLNYIYLKDLLNDE